MVGTYNAPGKKYKGQDDAPDETPSAAKPAAAAAAGVESAAPAPAKEEPKQSALTTSTGQIALVGSSIDPEYEKAKEARRRKRKQDALASTQAEGIER